MSADFDAYDVSLKTIMQENCPLLLMPIRIETRFIKGLRKNFLRIRVIPDQIMINTFDPKLMPEEKNYLSQLFTNISPASMSESKKKEIFDKLAMAYGPSRASWLLSNCAADMDIQSFINRTPTVAHELGALPDRWVAVGYKKDREKPLFAEVSGPILIDEFTFIPELNRSVDRMTEIKWMYDFEIARNVGMGVEIELDSVSSAGIDELYVFGIRTRNQAGVTISPDAISSFLEKHFEDQHYQRGGAFVPQGTPTNNTEEVESGWSFYQEDPEATYELEFAATSSSSGGNDDVLARALGFQNENIFKKFPFHDQSEQRNMKAMNTLLWEITWGEYLEQLIQSQRYSIPHPTYAWIRNWYRSSVFGGAGLPTIRFGSTPYGILPVQCMEKVTFANKTQNFIANLIKEMMPIWKKASRSMNSLEAVTEQSASLSIQRKRLMEMLSLQPHMQNLSQRLFEDSSKSIGVWYELVRMAIVDTESSKSSQAVYKAFGSTKFKEIKKAKFTSMKEEMARFKELQQELEQQLRQTHDSATKKAIKELLIFIDYLFELYADYERTGEPLGLNTLPKDFMSGALDSENPMMAFGRYHKEAYKWPEKKWVTVNNVEPQEYFRYLTAYAQSKLQTVTMPTRPFSPDDEPLLFQLLLTAIDRAAERYAGTAPADFKATLITDIMTALETLSFLSVSDLKLLMQQTFDTAGWRLDAWVSAFAYSRLETLRNQRSTGIYQGGYGFVFDLSPRESEELSQGFIHAPSVNHAKTAALLRSGWNRHKTEFDSKLFIDLSSERVNFARWVFSSLAQGADIGDLIAYRIEKDLLEGELHSWIVPLRWAVRSLVTEGAEIRADSLDGLNLVQIWSQGQGKEKIVQALEDLEQIPDFEYEFDEVEFKEYIEPLLNLIENRLDGLADCALVDSLHSCTQGNYARTGAVMKGLSFGGNLPSELKTFDLSTSHLTINHSVIMLLDSEEASEGSDLFDAEDPRALYNPNLENFIVKILSPENIQLPIGYKKENGDIVYERSLGLNEILGHEDFKIGALTLMSLLDSYDGRGNSKFEKWVRLYLETVKPAGLGATSRAIIQSLMGSNNRSETESELLRTKQWYKVIKTSRSLCEKDFSADFTVTADIDDLESRMQDLKDNLDSVLKNLAHEQGGENLSDQRMREWILKLGRFNLFDHLPEDSSHDELVSSLQNLQERALKIQKDVEALIVPTGNISSQAREGLVRQKAKLMLGAEGEPMILMRLQESNLFSNTDALLEEKPDGVHEWMEKYSYVKPKIHQLHKAMMVDEVLREENFLTHMIYQSHVETGDTWIGVSSPKNKKSNYRSLLAFHAKDSQISQNLFGFLVDDLTETLPMEKTDTGVAFHFDSPNTESPQVNLLAVLPAGESWGLDYIIKTIRQTVELSRSRGVDQHVLPLFDHHLPAIYASETLKPGAIV